MTTGNRNADSKVVNTPGFCCNPVLMISFQVIYFEVYPETTCHFWAQPNHYEVYIASTLQHSALGMW